MLMREKNEKTGSGTLEEGVSEALTLDRLKGYREGLRTLEQASEAVTGLRERVAGLEKRVTELELESLKFLDSDSDGAEEEESALSVTRNVVETKLSRSRQKLGEAEANLSGQVQGVRSLFGTLYQNYRLWQVECEKKKLLAQLDGACPFLAVDQVATHFKVVSDVARLEITAVDAEGVVRQAENLLEAIAKQSEFELPAVSMPISSGAVAEARAPLPGLYGPYLFRGMDERKIQDELGRIRKENPGLDLGGATRRLAELNPELFSTEAEVMAMNAPLDALATGIYEQEKGGNLKLHVPAIGSTHALT
jgi:hypothetical protein